MMYTHVVVAISKDDALAMLDAQEAGKLQEGISIGVLHAAAYPNEPSQDDIDFLYYELMTDERFGLLETDFVLCLPPADLKKQLLEEVNTDTQGKLDSGELLMPKDTVPKNKLN